jgi:hypothetical protein
MNNRPAVKISVCPLRASRPPLPWSHGVDSVVSSLSCQTDHAASRRAEGASRAECCASRPATPFRAGGRLARARYECILGGGSTPEIVGEVRDVSQSGSLRQNWRIRRQTVVARRPDGMPSLISVNYIAGL